MVSSVVIDICKAKQERGYKTLYEACIPYVYTIVKSYIHDTSVHRDLIQDIFAAVFLNLDTFDENKGIFKFWLRKVCVNQCLMRLRKVDFLSMVVPIDSYTEQTYTDNNTREPAMLALTREDIEEMLADMPSGYRTIFLLVAIDEYSHEEVSKMLNISAETSRSQYFRAKNWVRQNVANQRNMEKYGIQR